MWKEVRKGIGGRTDLDTELKQALNDAVVDLVLTFRVRQAVASETFTTETDTYAYDLNSYCLDVITVRNDTDAVLLDSGDYISFASVDYADSDATGTPSLWFVDGTQLYLYNSTPDNTGFSITYRYLKRYAEMTDDNDVFPLPREWERPSKLFAKSYMFELLGQNEKAIAAYQQGVAIARSRVLEGGWGEKLRGDNRVDMGYTTMQDEGY
jgi:hypothetical protein